MTRSRRAWREQPQARPSTLCSPISLRKLRTEISSNAWNESKRACNRSGPFWKKFSVSWRVGSQARRAPDSESDLFLASTELMSPELLLERFGYLAVFVGTFLEGETILVLSGF